MSCNARELLKAAACFRCVPPGMQAGMRTYLLCQWAGGGTDPDAQAFIDAAGLEDPDQQAAINQLVLDLKAYPATGTKYWERLYLAYPFVGGNDVSHSFNLVDPTQHRLTYHAVGSGSVPTHGPLGIIGSRVDDTNGGYANTNWQPNIAAQNMVGTMWYVQSPPGNANNRFYYGTVGAGAIRFTAKKDLDASSYPAFCDINNTATGFQFQNHAVVLGAYMAQRDNDGSVPADPSFFSAVVNDPWYNFYNKASGTPPASDLILLAFNVTAVPPVTAQFFADTTLSSFVIYSNLTDSERTEFKGIWDRFNTALGRGHPLGA